MDKRFQVFVSSTYEDLKEERQEVIQALLSLNCIPSGMELFPAADQDQWTLIKSVIDDCDFYIVIIGGRYGSTSSGGISYTQMEYEYAVSQSKPVLGFIHRDPGSIQAAKTERSGAGKTKLEAFRKLVQRKPCKKWSTPGDLSSAVLLSVATLIKTTTALGWVRADSLAEAASQEILKLKKKVEELEGLLERARLEAPKGTDDLAQGEDQISIKYSYQIQTLKDHLLSDNNDLTLSWNDIFTSLAPHLMHETSESTLKGLLDTYIRRHSKQKIWQIHREIRELKGLEVMDEDFQTIKIQLRALGLIMMSEGSNSAQSSETQWKLTPYGDNMLIKLRAIRKDLRTDLNG